MGLRESLKFARIIFIFYFRTYIFIFILVVLNPISTRDLSRMHEIRDWHSLKGHFLAFFSLIDYENGGWEAQ